MGEQANPYLRRWKLAVITVVVLVVAMPVMLVLFLSANYYWNKSEAASDMRDTMSLVVRGDSLDEVREVVAAAPVPNQYGHYGVWGIYLRGDAARDAAATHVVRGFWLRRGITCYSELTIVNDIVAAVGDVQCVPDGWFE